MKEKYKYGLGFFWRRKAGGVLVLQLYLEALLVSPELELWRARAPASVPSALREPQ